ncbi:hypothetical protein Lqui_0326 [Legionella quinlivanii]|uniref:Uncharacterized protein n=1 Tax=Legionella quinlivanii TaxID=45073 RepID=A0A0W0Y3X1_9GAMM|nr:hypothetical protein [Legionella quinlivanii]KTD51482.1 hypothetical protein Lqui_0326 [Legionella quinlivanii]SEF56625.1 hypothetical protein SAMN02746093_00463 [Legionella quinlivanii DSM 21216]STY10992.1 Uncharacterised protein [Legionella quinlivanii]
MTMPAKTKEERTLTVAIQYIDLIIKTLEDTHLLTEALNGPQAIWLDKRKIKLENADLEPFFSQEGRLNEKYQFDSRIDEFLRKIPLPPESTDRDRFQLYALMFSLPGTLYNQIRPVSFSNLENPTASPEFQEWHAQFDLYNTDAPKTVYEALEPVTSLDDFKKQLVAVKAKLEQQHNSIISIAETKNPQLLLNREMLKEKEEIVEGNKLQIVKDFERNLTLNGQAFTLNNETAVPDLAKALEISEEQSMALIEAQSQHLYYAINCFISIKQDAAINTQLSERGIYVSWNEESIQWNIQKKGEQITQTVFVQGLEFRDQNKQLIHSIDASLSINFAFNTETGLWERNDAVHFSGSDSDKVFMTELMNAKHFDINGRAELKPLVPYQFPKINQLLDFYLYDRENFAQRLKNNLPEQAEAITAFLTGLEEALKKQSLSLHDFINSNEPKELHEFLRTNPEIKELLERGEFVVSNLIEKEPLLMPATKNDAIVWKYKALRDIAEASEKRFDQYWLLIGKSLAPKEVLDALNTPAAGLDKPGNAWKLDKMTALWKQAYPDQMNLPDEDIRFILQTHNQFSSIASRSPAVFDQLMTHLMMFRDAQSKDVPSQLSYRVLITQLSCMVDSLPANLANDFIELYKNNILNNNIPMQEALAAANLPPSHPLSGLARQYDVFVTHSVSTVYHFDKEEANQKLFFAAVIELRGRAESPEVNSGDRMIIRKMADNLTMHGMNYFSGQAHDKKDLQAFRKTAVTMIETAEDQLSSKSRTWLGRQFQKLLSWIGQYVPLLKPKETKADQTVSSVKDSMKFLSFKEQIKEARGDDPKPDDSSPANKVM